MQTELLLKYTNLQRHKIHKKKLHSAADILSFLSENID